MELDEEEETKGEILKLAPTFLDLSLSFFVAALVSAVGGSFLFKSPAAMDAKMGMGLKRVLAGSRLQGVRGWS